MRQFNKTLLALAGVILLGASSALAQGVTFETGGSFTQLRGEGVTENVGQITLLANNAGTVTINSSITITYSTAITATAGAASISCIFGGVPAACANETVTISGSQFLIAFTAAQAFAVNDSITISQVRVNAAAIATAGGTVTATASAVSANPGTNPITFNPPFSFITVGIISFPSTTVSTVNSLSGLGVPDSALTCSPQVGPLPAATSFQYLIKEAIPNAWTTAAQEAAYTPGEVDAVTNGSWISVTLTGIPSGFEVTANAPSANGANPFPTIVLIGAGTAPAPGGTPVVAIAYGTTAASIQQTVAGTPVVFTFAFTATNLSAVEQAFLNFSIIATPSAVTVAPGGLTGPVTAVTAYDPLQPSPAPAVNTGFIARFTGTLGTLTVANISDCITRLLHPWVLGGSGGYDTGIAIANTTLDTPAFASGNAVPQAGTCTLTGYPVGGGTPIQSTRASVTPGNTDAFNLSTVTGFSGFKGYLLVVCNFLNAHDFIFITNGFGSLTGPTFAEGYLGLVVPNASRVTAGVGESLGN